MRKRLLTDKERQIIESYIETGTKLNNFSVLIHRCKNMQPIKEDLTLIEQFLSKAGEKTNE